jgi:hypothetical protein
MIAPSDVVPGEGRLVPRLFTRSLAILERCWLVPIHDPPVPPRNVPQCSDIVVVPRGSTPRILGETATLLGLGPDRSQLAEVRNAMALPSGGAGLQLRTPEPRRENKPQSYWPEVVLELNERGEIVRRRGFAWPSQARVRMLARTAQGVGLAVANAESWAALVFFGLDPSDHGRRLRSISLNNLRGCSDREGAARGAVTMAVSEWGYSPELDVAPHGYLGPGHRLRSEVEITAGGVCIRALRDWSFDPLSPYEVTLHAHLGGALQALARGGALVGAGVDRARDTPLRCRPR